MIRCFVALPLPDAIRSALAVAQFLLPLPRRVPPENFHLTLAFLGELPEPVVEDVHHALSAIRADRLALRLSGFGLFGGAQPRAVWAGVAPESALDRLQRKVVQAAAGAGVRPEGRRFSPHVTLGRFPPPAPDEAMRIERAVAAGAPLPGDPFPVDRFVLYRSHLTRGGAQYEALAEYLLI